MGFEMIRGSKNSWARTRTSEPATPDSEPDYLGKVRRFAHPNRSDEGSLRRSYRW